MHYVGAADSYISRQFQRRFFRLGLRGGAIASFLALSTLSSWWRATPGGDQVEVTFGDFSLSPNVYAAIVVIAAGVALLTGYVSRTIVFRHLRDLT